MSVPASVWAPVAMSAASKSNVVFYRAEQCQMGATNCVFSVMASTDPTSLPSVLLQRDVAGSCSIAGSGDSRVGTWLVATAMAFAARRRRRHA